MIIIVETHRSCHLKKKVLVQVPWKISMSGEMGEIPVKYDLCFKNISQTVDAVRHQPKVVI